ncbi:hypothetical protein WM40_23330 [Robbsia andropogonis]|uniref:Uncharacterized protein n=1 Tax=Robbsia andropogonis TaxID=28092 RepID=A0A0F5JU81_9BURK|nr:hypothetical protein [Robbsia andropogonis]KKB61403.1 hypothetical protein WM40_23330 [Robbsia andropogonis]MCP1119500.1 hypothetical protein [Robbsia andropogonis]MCP1129483.1 hypothetical protein [Robbsia andropogonis]
MLRQRLYVWLRGKLFAQQYAQMDALYGDSARPAGPDVSARGQFAQVSDTLSTAAGAVSDSLAAATASVTETIVAATEAATGAMAASVNAVSAASAVSPVSIDSATVPVAAHS